MRLGRPLTSAVERPPCPEGHLGTVLLDGRRRSRDGRYERTRYRCAPDEGHRQGRTGKGHHLPGEHVFMAVLPARREHGGHPGECDACERAFGPTEGMPGAWHFSFTVREAATALVRLGRGDPYRAISRELRQAIGRVSARGRQKGWTCRGGQLASDYLDAFGASLIEAVSPREWPRIVALDALPIRVRDHSTCCPVVLDSTGRRTRRRRQRVDVWGPPPDLPKGKQRRPKIAHSTDTREIGRILVAVGYERPGAFPRPWLIRFAGAGDQPSWEEFLRSLPGRPAWVVSDRDGAIINAVASAWKGGPTHYFCEQHLAENAAGKAREDGLDPTADPLRQILEEAQFGPAEWARAEGAADALGAAKLGAWLAETAPIVLGQMQQRRGLYPCSAGACETVIRGVERAISERAHRFGNATRLNLLLGLVRADLDGRASVAACSKVLRDRFAQTDGRSRADWWAIRDPDGEPSSIELLLADAQARGRKAAGAREAPKKAIAYRKRRAISEEERQRTGLPPSPRGRPRVLRVPPARLAGTAVADHGWLVAEWHPTRNGDRRPADVPTVAGELLWWRCDRGPDHDWQAEVRARALGSPCPFCARRRIAPSDSLARTHPDVAAQWHPTRNGTKTPSDFTFGSHYEAWWQCPKHKSHVWRSRISSRTSMVTGCPLCARLEGRGGRVRPDAEMNAVA